MFFDYVVCVCLSFLFEHLCLISILTSIINILTCFTYVLFASLKKYVSSVIYLIIFVGEYNGDIKR